jgi:hypothetical protein
MWLAWLVNMHWGYDDWVYSHVFTITVSYYSSQSILTAEASVYSSSRSTTASTSLESLIATLLESTNPLPRGPHRRHHVEQFLCCPVGCHRNLVFSTCYLVTTSSLLYVVMGTWFRIRCSTTDVWLWLHYSCFQPSRHNIFVIILIIVTVFLYGFMLAFISTFL